MIIIILNILALLAYIGGVLYFGVKYMIEKTRANELEKQLTGNMTDFEKLQLAAKMIKAAKIERLSLEQKKDWVDFIHNQKNIPDEFNDIVNDEFFNLI